MTSKNDKDDLFDGVEIPKRPERETEPDKPKASGTDTAKTKEPEGVSAARVARWVAWPVGLVLLVVAWSISVWLVVALAVALVVAMIITGAVHSHRSKRGRNRRRAHQRRRIDARSPGSIRPGGGRGGIRGAFDRAKQRLGIGGSSGGRGNGSAGGRGGGHRGGKFNPKNWGRKNKIAGQGANSAAASPGTNRKGRGRGLTGTGAGKSGGAGARSSRGGSRSGSANGTRRGGGAGRTTNPRSGQNISAFARNRRRRRDGYGNGYDPDYGYSPRPGFWQRRRMRKQAQDKQQDTTDTTNTTAATKDSKDEVKKPDKTQTKTDEYDKDNFPFDDAGFPVYIPDKQTNKQPSTSTNTKQYDDDEPVDDMGFPMYPATQREDMAMTEEIDHHTAADFDDPRQVLRETCLSTAAEAETKAKKARREAELMEQKARFYSQKGMDESFLKAKKAQEKLSESAKRYMGIKAANEEAASKARSF